jgi:hypothetical protein
LEEFEPKINQIGILGKNFLWELLFVKKGKRNVDLWKKKMKKERFFLAS